MAADERKTAGWVFCVEFRASSVPNIMSRREYPLCSTKIFSPFSMIFLIWASRSNRSFIMRLLWAPWPESSATILNFLPRSSAEYAWSTKTMSSPDAALNSASTTDSCFSSMAGNVLMIMWQWLPPIPLTFEANLKGRPFCRTTVRLAGFKILLSLITECCES